jgi:hypothetical protein
MLHSSAQVPELQTVGSRAHPQLTASAMAPLRDTACKSPLLFLTIHQRMICSLPDLLTSSWQLGHPLGLTGAAVVDIFSYELLLADYKCILQDLTSMMNICSHTSSFSLSLHLFYICFSQNLY